MAGMNNNGTEAVERTIDLRKIRAIVWKNWLVISRDRIRLVPLFVFPFIMVILFGYTAGTTPKHVPAAIVDYDNTQLSRSVQTQLYSNELFSIKWQVGSQEEGKRMIESGQIEALFIIPKGFEKDIESGNTAHLDIIADQSNPSVAQITGASTQLFVQMLSQQLNSQRLSALAKQDAAAVAELSQVKMMLMVPLRRSNEPTLAAMDASFKNGMYTGMQTNEMLGSIAQATQNSIGYPVNPIDVVNAYNKENVEGLSEASLSSLSTSDRQQSILQQLGIYQGMQGSNSMMLASLQDVYQEGKVIAAGDEIDREAVKLSYDIVNSASGKIEQLGAATATMAANPSPIALNQILPYGNGLRGLDYLLPNILALISFQGATMGLGRAVAGERRDGSLTRVFLTPTSNITIIIGTLLYYVLQETFRTMLIVLAAIVLFGLIVKGSLLSILVIIMLFALGSTGVGMVVSVITKSQEQYMAVSMLVSLPMMFLAGVFAPIETMPIVLQSLTRVLPITYAADALRGVMVKGFTLGQVAPDLTFLVGFGVVTLTLSLLLFKRELI